MNEPIGYGTGALYEYDSKNENFPVAALLDTAATPISRRWTLLDQYRDNQGSDPECVGAALTQELGADPVPIPVSHPYTRKNIYNLAQKLDEWPGEGYAGTSLLAGLKAIKQYGYIGEYRWATSLDDVVLSLSQLGPVTMAGPWLTGMFSATSEGQIKVAGTGGQIGHCYMLGEVDMTKGRLYVEMTWGPSFSVLGWRAWFSFEDVAKLLSMGTQAAVITQRLDPSTPTPPQPVLKAVTSANTSLTFVDGTTKNVVVYP